MKARFGGLAVLGCCGVAVLGVLLAGCQGGSKPLVAFAQANSQDPWRQVFDGQMKAAADQHASEFAFEEQDAHDDANTQIGVIETFLIKNPKVLLVSAADTSVTQACEKAFDKGIPVILLDRAIDSEKYTCYIGGDNTQIGVEAGRYLGGLLKGTGTILMIQGKAGATPTDNRRDGFMEAMKEFAGITVIQGDNCDYQRQKARSYMETFLQTGKKFDAIYAHNDEMAIGAYLALEAKSKVGVPIVGIDGCQLEIVDYIKAGKVTATFVYPTPGAKGIEVAAGILKGNMPTEKKIVLVTMAVTKENADQFVKDNPNLAK